VDYVASGEKTDLGQGSELARSYRYSPLLFRQLKVSRRM
jgi:hypothetical protein